MADSTNIQDYKTDLESLCPSCRKYDKCKDRTAICMFKKFAFSIAKRTYLKRLKKGVL